MERGKLLGLVLSLVMTASMVLLAVAYAAPNRPVKPNKEEPVPATNVELVKKVTVWMPGPPIKRPGQGKKKKRGAATGTLGNPFSGIQHAVVVGISDYPGTANDLKYCDDDAREMAQALTDLYGFSTDNVAQLLDGGATRSAILTAIDSIPSEAGEVVFFFSGHGASGIADDGDKEKRDEAIVAHDGNSLVPIWDGELRDAFSGFATSRVILAFDTCLAGGMKRDLEASGRVIAMASTENGDSYESDAWENGEFSYYFVDLGMLIGNANVHDYDGDDALGEPDQVTVEEGWD